MKYYFIFLFQLIVLSSYGQKNKEAEIDSLESEMMNFFQATLERNYGRKDALDLLVKGLERYHFNYLLDVDKARLKQINEKLYAGGLLHSYFVDGAILEILARCLFRMVFLRQNIVSLMLINKHPRISRSMVALLALLPIHYNMRI